LIAAIAQLGGCAHAVPPPSHLVAQWARFRLNAANNAALPGSLATAWSFETKGPISASPSVVDGTLFLGNNAGRFVALDVATGHERWQARLQNAVMSAPLVIGDNVIAGEGNENSRVDHGVVRVGSAGANAIVALDRLRGIVRWRALVGGTAMPTPTYMNGRIMAHVGNGDLVALAPETGAIAFTRNVHTIPSMVALLPIDGRTFVTAGQTQTGVLAIDAATGGTLWRAPFDHGSALGDCPPVSDGTQIMCDYLLPNPGEPYVKAGRVNEERAYALDARTGRVRWDVHLETGVVPRRNQAAIPLVDRGMLLLGSSIANAVHGLDLHDGRMVWRTAVGGPVKGGIVARDGIAYFGDLSGRLWALRERDGAVVGVVDAGTPFNVGSPIIVGRTLVIGSTTGRILALPLVTLRGVHERTISRSIAARRFAPSVLTRFRTGDRNHDGVLSPGELARLGHRDFASFDLNGDGAVTPLEFAIAMTDRAPRYLASTAISPEAIKRPSSK
jgi:outer membrane protein assembly factor BamB